MDLQKIRELIDVLMASDLAELEFAEGEHKLRLVRRAQPDPSRQQAPASPIVAKNAPATTPAGPPAGQILSPLYGIVHLAASPAALPFVQAGDKVHQGQVLCMVEAMKIFHEVKADRSACIDEVFVTSAQEIEAGAPLFRLAPAD